MRLFCSATAISVLGYAFSASAADFPGAGHKYIADFTKFRFEQVYDSATSLTWAPLSADGARGSPQTVAIKTQEVADKIFVVSWQEANKATVVQIQDYGRKVVFTNLTLPDGSFIRLQGSFTPAD